jgi:hypothetical protein
MPQDQLHKLYDDVKDEASFITFALALIQDRESVARFPTTADGFHGEWASNSIESFLEAAVAWAEDSNFGARPGPKSTNPWRLFATFLLAGRGYE